MVAETWKTIEGWEGKYEISDLGRVRAVGREGRWGFRSVNPPEILNSANKDGYRRVTLVAKDSRYTVGVHILVATAFLGPKPEPWSQVNHVNFNPSDNRAENLEWCTAAENIQHSIAANRQSKGTDLPQTKMTPELVLELRTRYARGESFSELAESTKLARATIRCAVTGKTWAHLRKNIHSEPLRKREYKKGANSTNAKITQEQADEIRRRFSEGEKVAHIVREMSLGRATVWNVAHGKTWLPR